MSDPDEPPELTPTEARQGRRGTHLFIILAISTLLAAIALVAFFVNTAQS
jgi:hypothetical protein